MDSGKTASVENLRPKTVPEGLVALGTISQVSESQMKIQITGGITCLVDQSNVNQVYCDILEQYSKQIELHKKEPSSVKAPPRLSQLFERGQQYVCKIIDKSTRKGYANAQDIHATLDPSSILEDTIQTSLLSIPQAPLQCVVKSIEDHGYHMDIGFKSLTGFLDFKDSDDHCREHNGGRKLLVGQVVRCCLKKPLASDDETRVIRLSLNEDLMKLTEFTRQKCSEIHLTERCILPGSKSFLTILKVERDGLIVNLMNEFAGFVSLNHLKDTWHNPGKNYKISDQLDCTVLYYNSTTNTFALSLRSAASRDKSIRHFLDSYHPGKYIDNAKVAFINGTRAVYFKIDSSHKAVSNVKDALDEDVGTMTRDEIHLAIDSRYPEASTHRCRVKSINLSDLVVVVGLRKEFLNQPHLSIEELKVGDFVNVIVKKIVKDGIVVSFGLNLRAIIMNEYLQDHITSKVSKKYPVGKQIRCRVLKIDPNKQPSRAYLTNKAEFLEPSGNIVDCYDKKWKGKSTHATIVKINPTGIIVEFFNDVKGFLPNRFSSSINLKEVGSLFKIGQVIACTVYRVDPNRRSMMVGIIPYEKIVKMKKEKKLANKEVKEKRKITRIDEKLTRNNDNDNDIDKGRGKGKENKTAAHSVLKSRRQRSEEAMQKEAKLRETEKELVDPDRPPQSIADFERLLLKSPNSADVWTKYSKYFLDNVETEKARIVCRRALKTINFRLEKEKLKIWLHLVRIEAKYGGSDKLRATIGEAAQVSDQLTLYRGAVKVLTNCGELDEAERLLELMLKAARNSVDVWVEYMDYMMEQRRDLDRSRALFERAAKSVAKSDLVNLKSRFARLEFKSGDVERGKTIFENLVNDNPKRTDLWRVYEQMIRKYGGRQVDSIEARQQNEQTLKRLAESIDTVSKKRRSK